MSKNNLIRTAIALLSVGIVFCALPSSADDKLQISASSGNAPFTVRVLGPEQLAKLGENSFQKWVGCSYIIDWGDGTTSPDWPANSDCGRGLEHTYIKAGTFKVRASIYHLDETDRSVDDWVGTKTISILLSHSGR